MKRFFSIYTDSHHLIWITSLYIYDVTDTHALLGITPDMGTVISTNWLVVTESFSEVQVVAVAQKVGMQYMRRIGAPQWRGRQSDGGKIISSLHFLYLTAFVHV